MSPFYLILIGVCFLIFELLSYTFVFLFFSLGFIIVGILAFLIEFSWQYQILFAFVLSLVLLFILKKPLQKSFDKNKQEFNEEFLNEGGVALIKNGMIYYKGTFFKSDEIENLKDGDKVEVLGFKGNKIILKRDL